MARQEMDDARERAQDRLSSLFAPATQQGQRRKTIGTVSPAPPSHPELVPAPAPAAAEDEEVQPPAPTAPAPSSHIVERFLQVKSVDELRVGELAQLLQAYQELARFTR